MSSCGHGLGETPGLGFGLWGFLGYHFSFSITVVFSQFCFCEEPDSDLKSHFSNLRVELGKGSRGVYQTPTFSSFEVVQDAFVWMRCGWHKRGAAVLNKFTLLLTTIMQNQVYNFYE